MKNFSNLYIFCFSSALVLLVAAALSFTSLTLSDKQKANIEIERKQNILSALGVETVVAEVEAAYAQYIKQGVVIKMDGTVVDGEQPEKLDLKKENLKPAEERLLPLYLAEKDGKSFIVIPVRGTGLWGPIWGNVALEDDMNTVYGATFDHKGETPGLGAEISTVGFQKQFQQKTLFDANRFVSVAVEKPGSYTANNHTVDAISGGTLTSKGLEAMLRNSLEPYQTYFSQHKSNGL
ncbi:MAG: NADH:ubiquinone reductase (Na(+)-transporting) subunit C [Bacteroidales bacterium]|jgi:Na+-transporting NADH:ubiquinone oxidoreductase subunit C|nr:NADH:ubiquinone reductase (Na(+)-transporting) subunit C [Bacteroidales bacterium]